MKLLFALMVFAAPSKAPQIYYLNGTHLSELHTIETAGAHREALRFFVHSPFELRGARIDTTSVRMCLPEIAVRRQMKLKGRWYTMEWSTQLTTGSTRHMIILYCRHGEYKKMFYVNVEGSKRILKPQGVN